MGHGYALAGVEPPLEELLDDQIAHLIMRRDGLEPADVWRSIAAARARLADSASDPSLRPHRDACGAARRRCHGQALALIWDWQPDQPVRRVSRRRAGCCHH